MDKTGGLTNKGRLDDLESKWISVDNSKIKTV